MVRRMSVELRHLQRYAEMAVAYARLETAPGYALKKYDLSAIVQQSLKKFNGEMIEKQISVTFDPVPAMVVTDAKWLLFMLEQILSNAFKYTRGDGGHRAGGGRAGGYGRLGKRLRRCRRRRGVVPVGA